EVLKELAAHTKNLKAWDQMALLKYGSAPIGKGGMACLSFFGLLWFVPLGVALVRRYAGKGKAAAARPGHFEDLGLAFDHPETWRVQTEPLGETGWSINLHPPEGSVIIQTYVVPLPDVLETMRESMKSNPVFVNATFTPCGGILAGEPARGYDMK